MTEDLFAKVIEDLRQRAVLLGQQAGADTAVTPEVIAAALEELKNALEELRVVEEELRQQNDELMEAREAEAVARQRYQELFDFAPDAYLVTDIHGHIQEANRAAFELFNLDLRFLRGKPLINFTSLEDHAAFRRELSLLTEHGEKTNWELPLRLRDSKVVTVSITVAATPNMAGRGFTEPLRWILRDITEHKRLEDELLHTRHIESIGALAGGIAHDFNNYLTAIIGDLNIAERRVEDAETCRVLERAERTSLYAAELSKQLLTFAKGGAPVTQPVSTRELIEHATEFALRGTNSTLRLELIDDLWNAMVDEAQISQVLTSLLKNAQEAMPESGIITVEAVNVSVDQAHPVAMLAPGRYIKISVRDQGSGILPEHEEHIFHPYFTTKGSNGLGLATAYSIVTRHQGRISFYNQPSGGTTFEVYLPATTHVPAALSREVPSPRTGKGKILVVDDEALIRVVVASMLRQVGYSVEVVGSGNEAVDTYREAKQAGQPFDVVVMDLVMPGGMDGEAATQAILNFDAEAKIVASSGYSNKPTLANYQKNGFRAIAPKPYTLESLHTVLQDVITA